MTKATLLEREYKITTSGNEKVVQSTDKKTPKEYELNQQLKHCMTKAAHTKACSMVDS
jgi:hypothetical protein